MEKLVNFLVIIHAPPRNIQQQQRRYSTKTSLCERRDIEKISPE
jgi:hypothetical protein